MAKEKTDKSRFDPNRPTVGQMYVDAQKTKQPVIIGDMTHEMTKSLVDDLNEALQSDPFNGEPFYVTVYEKKDLQMKNALLRRLYVTKYRPYPEDDTVVFHMEPKTGQGRFCWCLPHWSEMDNILMNFNLFDSELVTSLRHWKNMDLHHFGFIKDEMGNWAANPKWQDQLLN